MVAQDIFCQIDSGIVVHWFYLLRERHGAFGVRILFLMFNVDPHGWQNFISTTTKRVQRSVGIFVYLRSI